jgi:hypothetical protein
VDFHLCIDISRNKQIELEYFLPHSGFHFRHNPCTSCPYVGLCLGRPELIDTRLYDGREMALLCLMNVRTKIRPMLPKRDRRRRYVVTKVDEILVWEQQKEAERDTKFVELGRHLCELRAEQYWRVENLKPFDESLERRFPESRRKAY